MVALDNGWEVRHVEGPALECFVVVAFVDAELDFVDGVLGELVADCGDAVVDPFADFGVTGLADWVVVGADRGE